MCEGELFKYIFRITYLIGIVVNVNNNLVDLTTSKKLGNTLEK